MKLALVLLLTASPAFADDWVSVTVGSKHSSGHYCELNPGIGIEHGSQKLRLVGGFYKNSFCNLATYGGVMWLPLHVGELRAGGVTAAASGYSNGLLILPVLPTITWERRGFGVNLFFVPPILEHKSVIAVQVKVRF